MDAATKDKRTTDMTIGNAIKIILVFAIPLFIGNIFQQIYNIVDTMVAGHLLGDDAIASIGATTSIYALIINFAYGLNTGYSIIMTRLFGKHDYETLKKSMAFSFAFNIIVGIFLTILVLLLLKPLMNLIKIDQEIFHDAYFYIFIICAGMLATICYNMFASILRAVGNSKWPLIFLIISSLINIIMDLIFVAVLHLGVCGLALATITAQTISAVLSGIYLFKNYQALLPTKKHFKFGKELTKDMLSMGFSVAMMSCVISLGSVFFQGATNNLGKKIITAHTAARKIIESLMMPISSIATAFATFVGQNYGAGKMERIKTTLIKVLILEIGISILFAIIIYLFGQKLLILLSGSQNEEILKNGVLSLRLHFLMYPSLAILACLRTTMQAMGHKIIPVISSCMELGLKILSVLFLIPKTKFLGVCLTEPIIWLVCMIFLVLAYLIENKKGKIYINNSSLNLT